MFCDSPRPFVFHAIARAKSPGWGLSVVSIQRSSLAPATAFSLANLPIFDGEEGIASGV